MNFGLTPEQEMVVSTVRSFVENELYPLEAEVERTGEVPAEIGREITRKVQELGFYAPNIPEEFGGGGLDHLTFTLLERELGRASYALSVFWGRPSNILCGCNAEQRERYLLPAVRGERIDCLAMTEPEAGSDVRSMKTTARRDGGDWVIDGTKHFISHADLADFAIVFVATGSEETKAGAEAADHLLPGRPRHARLRDPAGLQERLAPRLPQLHPQLRRLPGARRPDPGRGGRRLRADEHLALRHPADRRRDQRRPGAARVRPRGRVGGEPQAVRPADRQVPGHLVQARRHGDRDRRRRPAHAQRRLAARPGPWTPTG